MRTTEKVCVWNVRIWIHLIHLPARKAQYLSAIHESNKKGMPWTVK